MVVPGAKMFIVSQWRNHVILWRPRPRQR